MSVETKIFPASGNWLQLALLLLTAIVAVTGCGEVQSSWSTFDGPVVRGTTQDISTVYYFYFHKLNTFSEIVVVPDDVGHLTIAGAEWIVPRDLTLRSADLAVTPITVSWSMGTTHYSAQGFKLNVSGRITIAENATSGRREVKVHLPALRAISKGIDAEPSFPHGGGFYGGSYILSVAYLDVYESKAAIYMRWQFIRALLVVSAVIIVGAVSAIRAIKKSRTTA